MPQGDAVADIYDAAAARARSPASQGDVEFLSWDGNPKLNIILRPHPLGVLVDYRLLAWNYPGSAHRTSSS